MRDWRQGCLQITAVERLESRQRHYCLHARDPSPQITAHQRLCPLPISHLHGRPPSSAVHSLGKRSAACESRPGAAAARFVLSLTLALLVDLARRQKSNHLKPGTSARDCALQLSVAELPLARVCGMTKALTKAAVSFGFGQRGGSALQIMGRLQASHPPHIHILPCRQISRPIKSPALWARQPSQSRPRLWRAVTVSTRQMRPRATRCAYAHDTGDRCVAGARHMRRLQLGLKDVLGLHERLVLTFCCRVEMAPIATEGRGGMIARLSASLIKVSPRGDMYQSDTSSR